MEATIMTFTADGRRLDVLLSEQSGLTRSRVATLMEEGHVWTARPSPKRASRPSRDR